VLGWLQHNLLLLAGLKAFGISIILTPILRDIFRSYNVVDQPGQRRVHKYPIPRIGGIPIAVAYAFALYTFNGEGVGLGGPVMKLLPGAGVVFLTGLIDDFFNLRPLVKLAGQIVAALLVFWSGLSVATLGSTTGVELPLWLNLPLTVFWLLLTTNALNLIDGLDGLCAGIGMVATLALFGAALLYGNQALAYATMPLAFALAGFLVYNINPATVFLGDSGALLIGFLLGCYGMIWTQKTSTVLSLLMPLVALSVPLLDVSVAVFRRMLRQQPIFGADRAHIHHRLLDRGLTPKRAVLVLYFFAALAAGLALVLIAPQAARFRNVVLVLLVVAIWLGLRELRYKEFNFLGKLVFGGEWQQTLQETLRLDQLTVAFQKAHTQEAWWMALVETARTCEWNSLRWIGMRGTQELIITADEPAWTFQVHLGENGTLEIAGGPSRCGIDLTKFATAVQQSSRSRSFHGEPSEVH
jgi:UDP-GlcNAc:undecaprenyl-phosphate/decaprenyl-phosphate GlcNAc-1-phosphate transferase